MKSIDLPKTRFHDLSHTFSVSSIRAGVYIKTLQEILGHHSAAFTLDTYGHVNDAMKKESAKKLEDFINSRKLDKQK